MRVYGMFGMIAIIGAGVALMTFRGKSPSGGTRKDDIDWYGL